MVAKGHGRGLLLTICMTLKRRLKEILCQKSVKTGDSFILTSGKTSNYYVDGKLTTLDPEGSC